MKSSASGSFPSIPWPKIAYRRDPASRNQNQGISQHLTDATEDVVKIIEKVTYGIYSTKIVQLAARDKFTPLERRRTKSLTG
ncbi:MAG: hypothetical protein ACYS30_07805 [Planctomycetota bacterium]